MRISDWSSDVCSSDLHDESPVQRYSRHRHPDTPERTVHASIIAVEKCLDRLPEDFPADRNAQPLEAVPSHALKVEHTSSSMNVCGFLTGETRFCTCPLLSPVLRCSNETRHRRWRLTPAVEPAAGGIRSPGKH